MNAAIERCREELAELCRRYHVRRLLLFGSATGQEFDPERSDFDFVVDFEAHPDLDAWKQYAGFAEDLEALLRRPVDLVEGHMIRNPYFREAVEESQVLLYET